MFFAVNDRMKPLVRCVASLANRQHNPTGAIALAL
jgi:hypothetical protein